MTLLLDKVREVGIPMRAIHAGYHVGWTTDSDKASAARSLGATVRYHAARDPRFNGWEVSFAQGREVA